MNFFYKIILFGGIFFSYLNVVANEFWIRLNSPTTATLRSCTFVDSLNGWAAGDSGIIIHTSNGGNTFVIQNNPVDYYINEIFFINKRLGWAVSNEFLLTGTTILKTTNGGINWTAKIFPDSSKIFRTIYFLDSLTGYLGGFYGAIFKTTNAGNSWFPATNDSSKFSGYPIAKFKFVSHDLGFACGGQIDIVGVVWRTTNAGLFWKAFDLSPEPFYDMFIRDPQRILAVGGDYEYGAQISKTSNAGINWIYESLGLFGQCQSIDFRTPNEAWMPLAFAETWAVSYDSGRSWSSIPTTDSTEILSVVFVDSLHGWAVGNEGVILKYNSTIVSTKNIDENVTSENFSLYQNYPNPFNPVTVINYQLAEFSDVKLKVYDVLGNEVAILVNQKQKKGIYSIEWDATNFPSGIYFYHIMIHSDKIEIEKFSETKKMLLLK